MKKVIPSPQVGGEKPKLSMVMLQEQINAQNDVINQQTDIINALIAKVNQQDFDLQRQMSVMAVKDCVITGLQKELYRLQQYTRRYSVTVAGIEKKRGEQREDLKKEVESHRQG